MSTTIDAPTTARPRSARWAPALLGLLVAAATLTGCLSTPGDTSQISFVSTTTTGGWTYDYYRNTAYGCSISGYQTFVIATKVGSDDAATRPLWVKMHGGGFGYFDAAGNPRPATNKTEESRTSLINRLTEGLSGVVGAAPQGFRMVAVSMCSHDLYAGTNTPDANNPNTLPDGSPRTTNGLLATKAAVQFATSLYPTDDFFLHGGSAGSAGSFHTGWGLEEQGLAPAGIIADSGIINQAWEQAQIDQGLDCARTTDAVTIAPTRWDSDIADPNNQPDLAVTDGRLATPILHVWNHADHNVCGATQMTCPLRDGTTVTMSSADCVHEPMRLAIEAQGPTSRSLNMGLCVDDPARVGDCDRHVPTGSSTLTNTDPDFLADYNAAMLDWVEARLADD